MRNRCVLKGLREVPTVQGLSNRSVPSTREHAATEFARLEHEKARLERELTIWLENQRRTEARMEQVCQRLSLLRQTLLQPESDEAPIVSRSHRAMPMQEKDEEGSGWREFKWEY
jgi:hypothetical protein